MTEYPVPCAAAALVPRPSQTPPASTAAVTHRHMLCDKRFRLTRNQTRPTRSTPATYKRPNGKATRAAPDANVKPAPQTNQAVLVRRVCVDATVDADSLLS